MNRCDCCGKFRPWDKLTIRQVGLDYDAYPAPAPIEECVCADCESPNHSHDKATEDGS